MTAMTLLWIGAPVLVVGAAVTILQARLERWEQRRHADD